MALHFLYKCYLNSLYSGPIFFNRTKLKLYRDNEAGNEATSGGAITNKLMSLNWNNGYTKQADFLRIVKKQNKSIICQGLVPSASDSVSEGGYCYLMKVCFHIEGIYTCNCYSLMKVAFYHACILDLCMHACVP